MSEAAGDIYFDRTNELVPPYRPGDDPRPLQLAFGRLFDDAATAVYLVGSDLDEVLIDRYLVARGTGPAFELAAQFLADAKSLKDSLETQVRLRHPHVDFAQIQIVGLRIIVRHDALSCR